MAIIIVATIVFCLYMVVSRFFTIYMCYKMWGDTNSNPCSNPDTRGLIWFPLIGDCIMFNIIASELGDKAFQEKQQKKELDKQLRETLKTELSRNKDLLIAAIEEVEQLKAS